MQHMQVTKTKIDGINKDTVIGRDLHASLGMLKKFSDWIAQKISAHKLVENVDYVSEEIVTRGVGKNKVEYHITIPAAMSIASRSLGPNTAEVVLFLGGISGANVQKPAYELTAVTGQSFAAPAHLAGVKTMSSVEIVEVINQLRSADRAELRHDHFMEKVMLHPGIAGPNFRGCYRDISGRERPCYYLPKREAELMVMSESLEVQTRVYDRLTELEAAAVPKLPQSYAEALLELAAKVQRNEALELENKAKATQIEQQTMLIETQKPAVEFVQEYVEKDGTMNFRSLAKLIGATEADFRNFLSDNKYRYREGTKWTHYKKWGDGLGNAGYFTLKVGVSPTSGLAYQQSYFTPKGVEFFTRKWKERNSKPPVLTRKAGPARPLPPGVH